ncbi:MAG TPA: hypothetical protein GXX72_01120 [Clostridiaceae bacterium]|nr:hypothetical protein [Clostridiaceae bacterium]
MKKKILLIIFLLSLSLIFTACNTKKESEENKVRNEEVVKNENEVYENSSENNEEDNNGDENSLEYEGISIEEEDLTPSEKFAHDYFTNFFNGEIDLDNSFVKEGVSLEALEEYFNKYKESMEFQDLVAKTKNGFKVDGSYVTDDKGESILYYSIEDDKIVLEDFYKEDIKINTNENLHFIINGIDSKEHNFKFFDEEQYFLIPYALKDTKLVIPNEVLGDYIYEDKILDGQELLIGDMIEVNDSMYDKAALSDFIGKSLDDLIQIANNKGSTTERMKYFEEGTPDAVMSAVDDFVDKEEKRQNADGKYSLLKITEVRYSFNDTLRVRVDGEFDYVLSSLGKTRSNKLVESALWIKVLPDNEFLISKAQVPGWLIK